MLYSGQAHYNLSTLHRPCEEPLGEIKATKQSSQKYWMATPHAGFAMTFVLYPNYNGSPICKRVYKIPPIS